MGLIAHLFWDVNFHNGVVLWRYSLWKRLDEPGSGKTTQVPSGGRPQAYGGGSFHVSGGGGERPPMCLVEKGPRCLVEKGGCLYGQYFTPLIAPSLLKPSMNAIWKCHR